MRKMKLDQIREQENLDAEDREIAESIDRSWILFTTERITGLGQERFTPGVLQGIVRALAKKVETSSWTHSGRGEVALCALDNLCDDLEVKA